MKTTDKRFKAYINILKEELLPAMGCTEPIAIAYAAAMARATLGVLPERVHIEVSRNIIKNVKSVVVPNTNGLKGIEASAVAGIVAGKEDKILEVISEISENEQLKISDYLKSADVKVTESPNNLIFDIIVNVFAGDNSASVEISYFHTNIVSIIKNGKIVYANQRCDDAEPVNLTDRSILTVRDIIDFAETVDLEDVKDLLEKQIEYNMAIAQEGINKNWGANVGSTILDTWGNDVKVRAKALAAAGADARMSGCSLPVIIVSGSGNQGITASVPVIVYAKEMDVSHEKLLRALLISNLITIHQKTGIGRLSAYCGVVNAASGAASGITWLYGGHFKEIAHTIVNSLATVSGIVCDGAKPSCAGKIAAAVEAGLLGFYLYQNKQQFYGGDGIVIKGVENTINNIGRLGREGMSETDKEIIRIMIGD
ncbi:MAG: serine dehydratase subunit alpha family protein [Desulfobacteraceae bacterium]|jgi:L-cysteine desulfidase